MCRKINKNRLLRNNLKKLPIRLPKKFEINSPSLMYRASLLLLNKLSKKINLLKISKKKPKFIKRSNLNKRSLLEQYFYYQIHT